MVQHSALHPVEDSAWHSCSVISPTTRTELQTIQDSCTRTLKSVKREKASMQAALAALEAEESQLVDRIEKLESATATWKILPLETWSAIFEFVLGDQPVRLGVTFDTDDDHQTTFPEHVCSIWRQMALRTPTLWSRVEVGYNELDDEQEMQDLTEHALEVMSRGSLRQLTLEFASIPVNVAKGFLPQYLSSTAARLESLDISYHALTRDFLSGVIDFLFDLPRLNTIRENLVNETNEGPASFWFTLPSVTSSSPWGNMRSLDVGSANSNLQLDPTTFLRLLAACPQVTICAVGLCIEDGHGPSPSEPQVVQSKLTDLEILFKGRWPQGTALATDRLILPSLACLRFEVWTPWWRDPNEGDIVDTPSVISLIQRSKCTIRDLTIMGSSLTQSELSLLLPTLPSLQGISLKPTLFPPAILERIATAELLPKLKYLKGNIRGEEEDVKALRTVAQSRLNGKIGTDICHISFGYHQVSSWALPPTKSEWWGNRSPEEQIIQLYPAALL